MKNQEILKEMEKTQKSGSSAVSSSQAIKKRKNSNEAYMSQWELTKKRFFKHKPAVVSFWILIFLYGVALFAEFVAPYQPESRRVSHIYAAPQIPRFSLTKGFYAYAQEPQVNPVTYKRTYYENKDHIIPMSFLVKGEPYKLWGLIPLERHFFGVDPVEYEKMHGKEPNRREVSFFFFGADKYGRDLLSRLVYGARVSLSVGLIGIFISFTLGLTLGGLSGYLSGIFDLLFQRLTEIIGGIPRLPLWMVVGAAIPLTWHPLLVYFGIVTVLSLFGWTGLGRMIRSKLLALREEDYAMAAKLMGASDIRIIFKHLLPGFLSQIIVSLTATVPAMILGETSLSFLGLGLRPPVVSWGVTLQDCLKIESLINYPWLFMPALFIITTVLSFNFFGDGMRDAADPYAN